MFLDAQFQGLNRIKETKFQARGASYHISNLLLPTSNTQVRALLLLCRIVALNPWITVVSSLQNMLFSVSFVYAALVLLTGGTAAAPSAPSGNVLKTRAVGP